jgi:hypothetical protein
VNARAALFKIPPLVRVLVKTGVTGSGRQQLAHITSVHEQDQIKQICIFRISFKVTILI